MLFGVSFTLLVSFAIWIMSDLVAIPHLVEKYSLAYIMSGLIIWASLLSFDVSFLKIGCWLGSSIFSPTPHLLIKIRYLHAICEVLTIYY